MAQHSLVLLFIKLTEDLWFYIYASKNKLEYKKFSIILDNLKAFENI